MSPLATVQRLLGFGKISLGTVRHHANWSAALNGIHEFNVYLPPGYQRESSREYPVLYLLHGYGDDAASWLRRGHVLAIADKLIGNGQMAETIIVMPSCYGDLRILEHGEYALCSDEDLQWNTHKFIELLISEVIPRVEKEYRVWTNGQSRAIAGVSMGGAQALEIGITHAESFCWVGAFSAAEVSDGLKKYLSSHPGEIGKSLRIWLSCDSKETLFETNLALQAQFKAAGYSSALKIVDDRGHHWKTWRNNLVEFMPLLFRDQ
jgi:enterochelin esterase-like enzyme